MDKVPSIADIKNTRERLGNWVVETPVWLSRSAKIQKIAGPKAEVFFKLELFQYTGTFKPRGALTTLLNLEKDKLKHGVVAASGGNHAIAVAYAASIFGTSAKVVMPKTASPIRMQRCKDYGAEVILVDSMGQAIERMHEIAKAEGRHPIHPFEGPFIALGTGTIGLELSQQIKDLDAVVVPIGGGGLLAGIAAAIKQILPNCKVYGVEPEGADSLYRSLKAGKPVAAEKVQTIADSLAAPASMPYSFSLCQKFVDDVVLVSDEELKKAMALMFYETKLAVEPAGAAAMAGLMGPLKERLQNKRIALIACGTNIDIDRFNELVKDVKL